MRANIPLKIEEPLFPPPVPVGLVIGIRSIVSRHKGRRALTRSPIPGRAFRKRVVCGSIPSIRQRPSPVQIEEPFIRTAEILLSPLLTLDELGPFREACVTYSVRQNGRSHSPSCRQQGKDRGESMTTTLAEFRARRYHERACRTCGGADLPELTSHERTEIGKLVDLLPDREEAVRRRQAAERAYAARVRAAEAIDERADRILNGWGSLADERRRAEGRPAGVLTAVTACSQYPDCDAEAELSFDQRTLEVGFRCPVDPAHGRFLREDGKTRELWRFDSHIRYDALALIVTAIADGDDSWAEVYGTRAHDHRKVIAELRAFDETNPQPMELGVNVLCGLCGRVMDVWDGDAKYELPPAYSCDRRHADGRYHHADKAEVDTMIDYTLLPQLHGRFQWVLSPELAPDPASLVSYADHLQAKINTYDTHIGAAKADGSLKHQRERLTTRLALVRAIQEQGVFTVARLDALVRDPWTATSQHRRGMFTDLGRALLVERVVCHRDDIEVFTRFDEDTALYRRLRAEDLREQIAAARSQLRRLEEELARLGE
ncbi:hypothetical protein ACFQ08_00365 [Streptosporangium algeriense]|uniref:Recombinase zinc beta ribbon domain-containing protein n=1 Tax=Streptosporangium algeriense TaxID=1682748 RepID=A0ABW3DGK8_9ACTN